MVDIPLDASKISYQIEPRIIKHATFFLIGPQILTQTHSVIGLRSWMNMRSMLSLKAASIVISRIVKIIRGITGEKCSETDLKII